jgi:ABC-type multidrug transport system ATPase subunit
LPQEFGVYPRISAQDMLDHLALLKGFTNARERKDVVAAMLQRCNLYNDRKKALTGFSGGMRQRFGIAQALIGSPQLLIVDEPTAGLDPGERNRFYNLLAEVGERVVVILSTHIVEDVMDLCTHMAIINQGRVLYEGEPQDAISQLNGRIWQRSIEKTELAHYEQTFQVVSNKLVAGRPFLHVYGEQPPGDGFRPSQPDLEDVFFTKIRNWN